MAFDSIVMTAVVAELSERLTHGRISKIYQPQPEELALTIYAGGLNHRLLLNANARFARLHLTRIEKQNPPAPPTFCMLLRKYIEGGRILSITQAGRDRICRIQIGVTDELGNPAEFTLVAEVMSKHSNIVLLGPQGRIVDAIRRVTEEVNRHRELLPGLPYIPPPLTEKLDPATLTPEGLNSRLPDPQTPAWRWLLDAVDGLGPLLAREAVSRSGLPADASACSAQAEALASATRALSTQADTGPLEPRLLYDHQDKLTDFHVLPLRHWTGRTQIGFGSVSLCLEAFYGRREENERFGALRGSLAKLVRDEEGRTSKKLQLQTESLRTAEGAEKFRLQGELITAHLWQISKGDAEAVVTNYYDPEGSEVRIRLDPALGPAENAQRYYRRYQKARSGLAMIREQLIRSQSELSYLEQVEASLAEASSMPDLEEIRRELQAEGYLKARRGHRGREKGHHDKADGRSKAASGSGGRSKGGGSRDEKPAPPLTIQSTDGLEIWVGRNNRQNDYLTLKLAAPHDLWFHTKEIAGSHVILRVSPGHDVPERAIHEAAALAAYHSRGRASASVPVDYTYKKHVRKPSGARPGMVIYDHQKTLWVTPDPALNPILHVHTGGDSDGAGAVADPNRGADSGTD